MLLYYYENIFKIIKSPYRRDHQDLFPGSQINVRPILNKVEFWKIDYFEESLLLLLRFLDINDNFLNFVSD